MPTNNEITPIPAEAHARLKAMRPENGGVFTSDLSVNEFLLINEVGFKPAGMVVGSSIYHIGYQQASWRKSEEMVVLSKAMYHARELAMERMEEEARELGAVGVVGVRLKVKHMSWNTDLAEFVAIGTAVFGDKSFLQPNGRPFTSDLSGQDFWTLLKAGYKPVSMVMGNCVYHIAHQSFGQWFRTAGMNAEMTNFTQGLYEARELAQERMQDEAKRDGAKGIVGVDLHEGSYGWDTHVIEFFVIGTSILPISENHHIETPQTVLSLNG